MNELAFADAVRPMPASVLRLRLMPYSIGHEILLRQTNNALLGDELEFNKLPRIERNTALISAVMICCRSWKENEKRHKWLRLWGWLIRRSDWTWEIAKFRTYRQLGSTLPRILPMPAESGRVPGGDLMARLIRFVHFDFDFPFGAAIWVYFCAMEAEGNCRIENTNERSAREMEEQILSERRGKCPV